MKKLIQYSILYALIVITQPISTCPHDGNIDDPNTVIAITTPDHHQNFLTNNLGPSAVLYHMNGCHYCKETKPIFTDLAGDDRFDHITFYSANGPEINAENDVANLTDQKIDGYPTIFFFNQGEVVDSQVGAADQNVIIQKLNNTDPATTKAKKTTMAQTKKNKPQAKSKKLAHG